MSVADSKLAASIMSSVTHSSVATSIADFNDTKMETIHAHEVSFIEKYLFPLLSEANRATTPITFLKIFEYVFLLAQVFLIGQFGFLEDSYSVESFRIFYRIFFLGFSGDFGGLFIPFICFILLNIITALFLLFAAIFYSTRHEIARIVLVCISVWNGSLYNLMIIPNTIFLFATFGLLGEKSSALNVFFCVSAGICLFFSIYHYYSVNIILNRSPYLLNTMIQLWRPNTFYVMLIALSFSAGAGIYVKNFTHYFRIIPNLIYICTFPFFLYQFWYDNFTSIFFNVSWFSVPISSAVSAILSIFITVNNKSSLNPIVFYIVPFGVMVILTTLSAILMFYRRKKIKKQLHYPAPEMTDEQKQIYIGNLGIKNINQAFLYLQVGLENASDLFIDWSLHTYLVNKFADSNDLLTVLTWYVSLFPSTIHLMHSFIMKVSKMISPSNFDKALFVQLHRVHIFRQSSACKEANVDYKRLHNLTERIVCQYTEFWASIRNGSEITDGLYERMTSLRLEADASWAEVIDKYPNNSRFAHEYSRYLLEGRCRYKSGFRWYSRAMALEKGKKLENDQIFHHFITMYPRYIKEHIVDQNGTLTAKSRRTSNFTSSDSMTLQFTQSSSDKLSSSDSYETDECDSEPERIMPMSQLKMALERSVNVLSSPNINRVWVSAIIRLILTLTYSAVCFGIVSTLFHDKDRFFDCYKCYARASHYLSITTQQMIWYWGQSLNPNIMSPTAYSDAIGPLFFFYNNFDMNLSRIIYNMSTGALKDYSNMSYEMYKARFSSSNELVNLTKFLSNTRIDNNVCYYDKVKADVSGAIKYVFSHKAIPDSITADYLIRINLISMANLSLQGDEQRKSWSSDTDFCTYIYHHWDVFEKTTELIKNIMPLFNTVINKYDEFRTSEYLFQNISIRNTDTNFYNSLYYRNIQKNSKNKNDIKINGNEINDDNEITNNENENNNYEKTNENANDIENKIPDKYDKSSDSLDSSNMTEALDLITNVIISFTPFVCMTLILPLIIFLSVGVHQEWQEYTDILRLFPSAECERAATRLQSSKMIKVEKNPVVQDNSKMTIPPWLPNFLSAFIVIGVLLTLGLLSRIEVQDISHHISHFVLMTQMQNTLYMMGTDTVLLIFMNEVENGRFPASDMKEIDTYMSVVNVSEHLQREIDIYTIINNLILYGGPTLPGSIGKESNYDDIKYDEKCTPNYDSRYPIDFYNCISYENLISYYTQSIKMIFKTADRVTLDSSILLNLAFLVRTRMSEDFLSILDRFEEIYFQKREFFMIIATIFLVIACIACVIAFIFDFLVIRKINCSIETFKDLVLRIDPIAFVANQKIVSLIYGKDRSMNSKIVSATHAIFFTSKNGMISLNKDKFIETLNPSSNKIFGFTPEQMLGQHISSFIPDKLEANLQLYQEMQLMIDGQSNLVYEGSVVGIKDNESEVPLRITLLGLLSNKVIDSFALMFKDQTEESQLREALERARKQSEGLLYQMLPQAVISRFTKGDRHVSFTVKSASIIFVDIEKFSAYVSTMNPSELMKNIRLIINSYDTLLKKYFLLTKIKVMGDCYMVGSGLFSFETAVSMHANQALLFALDCLDSIEDINLKLNSNLQIRIGINTGGPLIAAVFGSERPVFDIIGEAIMIASKLQSTGTPSAIHISQETYELVATNTFQFEPSEPLPLRNGVVINTYLVPQRQRVSHENSLSYELSKPEDIAMQFVSTDNVDTERNEPSEIIKPPQRELFIEQTDPSKKRGSIKEVKSDLSYAVQSSEPLKLQSLLSTENLIDLRPITSQERKKFTQKNGSASGQRPLFQIDDSKMLESTTTD